MICQACGTVFVPTRETLTAHANCVYRRREPGKPGGGWTVNPFARPEQKTSDFEEGFQREAEQERARRDRWEQEEREAKERKAREWDEWNKQNAWNKQNTYSGYGPFNGWAGKESRSKAGKERRSKTSTESQTNEITLDRVRKLLLLCHPDKHGNSELSGEITRWLIDVKKQLETQ